MSVVHDASSLLAVAFREPGAELARTNLRGSFISSVNWSEVVQKVRQQGGRVEGLTELFGGLGVSVVPFTREAAERAAALYPLTRPLGLSLGDRACLALGLELGERFLRRTGVGQDSSWTSLLPPSGAASSSRPYPSMARAAATILSGRGR